MKANFKKYILIGCLLFIIPISLSAKNGPYTVKEYKWWSAKTSGSGLGLDDKTYHTRKGSSYLTRETHNIAAFKITESKTTSAECTEDGKATACKDTRWFCVEPGVPLQSKSDPSMGYNDQIENTYITTTNPPTTSDGYTWDVAGEESNLEKLLSCWYNNRYSIIATQAITWEIVTDERQSIEYNNILKSNYTPHEGSGSVFGNRSGITSLYELITGSSSLGNQTSKNKLEKAYKETLACMARFYVNPSNARSSSSDSKSNPKKLSTYNANTEKFSGSISDDLLNYYKISNYSGLSSSEVSLKNGTLSVNTDKEILSNSPATITLEYTYITKDGVDGSSHKLRQDGPLQFLVNDTRLANGKRPQAMARGSISKTIYISFYTGKKPTYQLKIKKEDDAGKPLANVQFYICSANSITSGGTCNDSNKLATIKTDSTGYATLTGIKHIGGYVATEFDAPEGYIIDKTPANITVSENHKTGSSEFASANKVFKNKKRHLIMNKRTIKDGEVVDLQGDSCTVAKCVDDNNRDNGPIFNIKKDDKYVCVKQTANGKYTYASLSENCASGTTKDIKTCNGKFDIELIPSGNYLVSEVEVACGTTLPSNPNQTVHVSEDTKDNTVTMLNGVTGAVLTKVTENGTLLDGGKFALQKKENGLYRDLLLVHKEGAVYDYNVNATSETEGATYLLDTVSGIINVTNLPKGEYRFVEKQAPSGYDLIPEVQSTATFKVSDKNTTSDDGKTTEYYQVKLVNQTSKAEGNSDQAELVVAINTGRKVINYPLVLIILISLLAIGIIIRKKMKK